MSRREPSASTGRSNRKGWARPNFIATLENLRQESCPRNCRLRLLDCSDSAIPGALCLPRNGSRQPSYPPMQRDGSSDRRLDGAVVPRSHPERPFVSVPDPRSRFDLLTGVRPATEECRQTEGFAHASASSKGECVL